MPQDTYEVRLSVSTIICPTKEQAIAQASSFLAYADHTDYFGWCGTFERVDAEKFEEESEWVVSILFEAPVANSDEIERFIDNVEGLSTLCG